MVNVMGTNIDKVGILELAKGVDRVNLGRTVESLTSYEYCFEGVEF